MIEVRLVAVRLNTGWSKTESAEKEMGELMKDGFLILRADTTEDSIVYVLTRQLVKSE